MSTSKPVYLVGTTEEVVIGLVAHSLKNTDRNAQAALASAKEITSLYMQEMQIVPATGAERDILRDSLIQVLSQVFAVPIPHCLAFGVVYTEDDDEEFFAVAEELRKTDIKTLNPSLDQCHNNYEAEAEKLVMDTVSAVCLKSIKPFVHHTLSPALLTSITKLDILKLEENLHKLQQQYKKTFYIDKPQNQH